MSAALSNTALAGLFATLAGAVQIEKPHLRGAGIASMPMLTYRSDCFKKNRLSLLGVPTPGFGMDPSAVKPFQDVHSDGFFEVDCVKDYLFEHGDKFGDNAASYKLGPISNVSIIHYSAHVAKEDREEMTHEACFLFCRSVPDAMFFGITNGRECYCAPYYRAEADDSSQCDQPCDGNPSTMCGGKSKSSIFAMHRCGDTLKELQDAAADVAKVVDDMLELQDAAHFHAQSIQQIADFGQGVFGHVGDPGASDLMQTAKVTAGEIEASDVAASKLLAHMDSLTAEAEGFQANKLSAEETKAAEDLTAKMEDAAAKGEAAHNELHATLKNILRAEELAGSDAAHAASDAYYPLTYFVDKELEHAASTCTGVAAAKPIHASQAACARICDEHVADCVGFSFFPGGEGEQQQEQQEQQSSGAGLCFMMSKFTTARAYPKCVGAEADEVMCFAKLSKFESTSIAPKGDGRCENCLKKFEKADRCFIDGVQDGQQDGQQWD